MPKVPRDLSHGELVRILQRDGWAVLREGRHTIMSKGADEIAIPRHVRLKTGTVAAILRQAGITAVRANELR